MKEHKYKYCAYPFLNENEMFVDYELLMDGLSSQLGFAQSCILQKSESKYFADIKQLCEISLHLNTLFRKPSEKILTEQLVIIEEIYQKYFVVFKHFYLPLGTQFATAISSARMTIKLAIRVLVKAKCQNAKLLDALNLLCNICHLIWLDATNEKYIFEAKKYTN